MAITLYSLAVYHDFKGPLFFVRQSGPCLKLQAIVLVMTGTENEVLVHNHGPVVLLAMPRTIGPWLWPNFTKSLYNSRVVVIFLPFLYQTAVIFNVQKWFPYLMELYT